jgi:3-oxoacyl-[acyl-carrier protein] reductase
MNFKDKVVVVTGGAQGIGKQIALQFAQAQATVVIIDVNQQVLTETKEELSQYSTIESMVVNIADLGQTQAAFNKIIDNFKRVDILVNNAGITRDNLMLRLSESDWDSVLNVNLKGAFNCIKSVTRPMIKQRGGKIINISSIVGIIGNAGQVNYSASKAALIGVTKTLAKELGSRQITVNAVAPGYIDTKMTQSLSEKVRNKMLENIPLARFGKPEDVANAVIFLASGQADYINSQVIVVDGGMI